MDNIRVMVVDDQALMCQGIKTILECEADMTVVATASNGQEAIDRALAAEPDVILMDLNMPVLDGVQSSRRILQRLPSTKIIVLTVFDDDNYVFEGVLAGAAGYLMKDVSAEELIGAVRSVVQGGAIITPKVAAKILKQFGRLAQSQPPVDGEGKEAAKAPPLSDGDDFGLTNREWDILGCLAKGLSNKEIAQVLHIADGTVKNHICHIFDKLQLRDRTQAAVFALRHWPAERGNPG